MTFRDKLRVTRRLLLAVLWTLPFCVARFVDMLLGLASRRLENAVRRYGFRFWGWGLAWIFGWRITIEGPRPKDPFFLVTNHFTYFDVLIIVRTLGCAFISRADVADWPFFGLMGRAMNTIFVDRERMREVVRVNKEIHANLERGISQHVFAESRIYHDGYVHPFKTAFLLPPIELGLPVHCATITYRVEGHGTAYDVMIWRPDKSFLEHGFAVLSLRRVHAKITLGEESFYEPDRKELAEKLHAAVLALYVPIDGRPE